MCWKEKIQWQSVTNGLRKEHVFPPFLLLLEPSNVRAHYIRKTADLLLQLWVSTFPRFVAIGFYFLSEFAVICEILENVKF
jgi:hypothetical protein